MIHIGGLVYRLPFWLNADSVDYWHTAKYRRWRDWLNPKNWMPHRHSSADISVLGSHGISYYHWWAESMPAIAQAIRESNKQILIPDNAPAFVHQSLAWAFGDCGRFSSIPWSQAVRVTGSNVQPRNLKFPVESRLEPVLSAKITPTQRNRRIFVDREDAKTRRVLPQAALLEILGEFNFERVILGGLQIQQQAKIFAEASVIMGPHGAGLANAAFAAPGAKLIELVPRDHDVPAAYMNLANMFDLEYSRVMVGATKPSQKLPVHQGMKVDLILDDQALVDLQSSLQSLA